MKFSFGRHVFGLVAVAVLAVTLVRVFTAPERIKARLETAQSTCVASGGKWTRQDNELVCLR